MIRTTKDGRTIRTGRDYTELRYEVWLKQNRCCIDCDREISFEFAELHHKNYRGMGGSKRSDTPQSTEIRCRKCHRAVTPQPQWTPKSQINIP